MEDTTNKFNDKDLDDACVIAAAPQMLATLIELKKVLNGRRPIHPASVYHDAIDYAIDAARGIKW
tara:strand:+ start:1153 stop:1347 length:195 start_codon:yes stop_codon:yes gene_type:complete